MKRMLEEADKHKKKKLTTDLIHKIYYAPTNDAAEKCIALIPQEKGKQLVRILGGIFFLWLQYVYSLGKYYERLVGKKSLLNIIVHLCVHIHVCILLLDIGRDIGSICTRMLLKPNIVIQLCINYSNIYILLVRISYVI